MCPLLDDPCLISQICEFIASYGSLAVSGEYDESGNSSVTFLSREKSRKDLLSTRVLQDESSLSQNSVVDHAIEPELLKFQMLVQLIRVFEIFVESGIFCFCFL